LYYSGKPVISISGRTSTVPTRAPGTRAAMPIASSRSLAWIREIPRDLLPRLDERPVGHDGFAIAHSNDGCRRGRLERRSAEILSAGVELVREAHGFGKHLLLSFFSELVESGFVMMNQQQVFHRCLLKKVKAPR
jgi:hypothetical protein